jgi:hypothetical protein
MEGFSFVSPVTGLNRSRKDDDDGDDDDDCIEHLEDGIQGRVKKLTNSFQKSHMCGNNNNNNNNKSVALQF